LEILQWLKRELLKETLVSFEVLSPDTGSHYSGSVIEYKGQSYIYRSLKSWIDLANCLQCKMHVPIQTSSNKVMICFEKLKTTHSFHHEDDSKEKYGTQSQFALLDKSNEFAFAYYYYEALQSIPFQDIKRVLNLGINRGDEFQTIQEILKPEQFHAIEFIGVDHSQSAIEYATRRFQDRDNCSFYIHDINALQELNLGRFDLLITIATLQSVHSNFKQLFMDLVQNLLSKKSSIIMGFPNSRWIDGELVYGAKVPHYQHAELSTVIKDIYFCKKYLQQHKYRVKIIGREYIFLIATKII
jgi:hypothetical protein